MDFHDIVAELSHGKLPETKAEERVNPDEPQEESKDQVADPDADETKDKPDEEPESEAKDQPKKEADTSEGAKDDEPATEPDEEKEADKTAETTVDIDGQAIPLSQLREWRDQGLMREDYTRKSQENATLRTKLLEQQAEAQGLARDIADDVALQQFLAARPGVIGDLMANPESTRKLIGNPKAVETFWKQFDILKENPELAERFISAEPSEAEAALELEQERRTIGTVVDTLEGFIEHIFKEGYADLGDGAYEEVSRYVAELSGIPEDPQYADVKVSAGRLFSTFYRQKDDGEWTIDPRLIIGAFDRIKASKVAEGEEPLTKEKEVQEHNATVDQQLKSDERPPKTPDGQAPIAEGDKPDIPDNFQEILGRLSGH